MRCGYDGMVSVAHEWPYRVLDHGTFLVVGLLHHKRRTERRCVMGFAKGSVVCMRRIFHGKKIRNSDRSEDSHTHTHTYTQKYMNIHTHTRTHTQYHPHAHAHTHTI